MSQAQTLLGEIRKNRELKIPVGKYVFTCRRPTDSDIERYRSEATYSDTLAQRHVCGWARVDGNPFTEDDYTGGGGSTEPVPFDALLWVQWCADHMEVWEPIGTALTKAYVDHRNALELAEKNS